MSIAYKPDPKEHLIVYEFIKFKKPFTFIRFSDGEAEVLSE